MGFLKRLFGTNETKADLLAEYARVSAEHEKLMAETLQGNFSNNHSARLQAVKKKMEDLLARAKKL